MSLGTQAANLVGKFISLETQTANPVGSLLSLEIATANSVTLKGLRIKAFNGFGLKLTLFV